MVYSLDCNDPSPFNPLLYNVVGPSRDRFISTRSAITGLRQVVSGQLGVRLHGSHGGLPCRQRLRNDTDPDPSA